MEGEEPTMSTDDREHLIARIAELEAWQADAREKNAIAWRHLSNIREAIYKVIKRPEEDQELDSEEGDGGTLRLVREVLDRLVNVVPAKKDPPFPSDPSEHPSLAVRVGRWLIAGKMSGRWLHLVAGRAFPDGVVTIGPVVGWDVDVPLRPWPQLWFEVRPNGSHLAALVWCGFGVQVQTWARPR